MYVRLETLEDSTSISHSICSAMCKMGMKKNKWYLQFPELLDQGNYHAGSIQFQNPLSEKWQYPKPQEPQKHCSGQV